MITSPERDRHALGRSPGQVSHDISLDLGRVDQKADRRLASDVTSESARIEFDCHEQDLVSVVVIEHDPISRNFIEQYLVAANGLRWVASTDGCGAATGLMRPEADLAVLCYGMAPCCSTPEGVLATARPRVEQGQQILLLGNRWSRALIESAVNAGVGGFLVKKPNAEGLTAGILALAAGQCVISPELARSYFTGQAPSQLRAKDSATSRAGREHLTARERQVLELLARGVSTEEAASTLRVSAATIKSHVSHSLTKLGARNRLEAVLLLQET